MMYLIFLSVIDIPKRYFSDKNLSSSIEVRVSVSVSVWFEFLSLPGKNVWANDRQSQYTHRESNCLHDDNNRWNIRNNNAARINNSNIATFNCIHWPRTKAWNKKRNEQQLYEIKVTSMQSWNWKKKTNRDVFFFVIKCV